MTIAIHPKSKQGSEQPLHQKQLSVEEFLARYGGDNRYELIDGEVFDLEPTGPHEQVAAFMKLRYVFRSMQQAYLGLSCSPVYYTLLPWG
jgi:hypothetical protein